MNGKLVKDYAKEKGKDRGTIYRWIKKGYLETYVECGKTYVIGVKK